MSSSETQIPVTLTDLAVAKVQEVLAQQDLSPEESFLRLFVSGNSCCGPSFGLAFDEAHDDDVTFDTGSLKVVVDPMSLPLVQGATIDFVESPEVTGFRVSVPSSGGGCNPDSCGPGACGPGGCA